MVFRNQKRLPTIGSAHLEGSRKPSKAESAALQHRRPQLSRTEQRQRLSTGNSFMEFPAYSTTVVAATASRDLANFKTRLSSPNSAKRERHRGCFTTRKPSRLSRIRRFLSPPLERSASRHYLPGPMRSSTGTGATSPRLHTLLE